MCFYIHYKYKEAIVATKDIRCWKVTCSKYITSDGFLSKYKAFPYSFGKTYKTTISEYLAQINQGFHSYSSKPFPSCNDATIYCKIPKGSVYYYNPDCKEYASNQIIPLKVVKNKSYE